MASRRSLVRFSVAIAALLSAVFTVGPAAPSSANTGCPTASAPPLVNGVYEIDQLAELQWAKDSGTMSNSYKLTDNISMTGCTWTNGIGSSGTPFTGAFDGNNKTISNLTISGGSTQNLGLFDFLNGSVTDLTLASPTVSGTSDWVASLAGQLGATGSVARITVTGATVSGSQMVGGVIGTAASGATVSNVSAGGTVTATTSSSGGIAGTSQGTMTNLTSSATVSGSSRTGGLVGTLSNAGSITNGTATGAVTGTSDSTGGAVGFMAGTNPTCGTVTNVTASGRVEGTNYLGGLVGYGNCYFIVRSSSSSTVVGSSSFVGGLVGGENFGGSISGSFFTGSVQGTDTVGGLAGATRSTITDSYSTGTVTATTTTNGGRAGGLVGWLLGGGNVSRTYASGTVTVPAGGSTVGGLIASSGGSISASAWDRTTTGQSTSGGSGATGHVTAYMKNHAVFGSLGLNWTITDGISAGNGVSTGTTWSICTGANQGYPFLTRQGLTGTCLFPIGYDGNSNTTGTAPTDSSSPYTPGDTVTVLDNTGNLTRTSRTFAGWNTKADGTGTSYSVGQTFSIANSMLLYAVWSTSPVITYNPNGGTGTISNTTGASGSSVTLSTGLGFTRTGFTLSRWDTSAAGTGSSYSKGQSITMPAGGLTLYAVWEALPAVTYNSNGGSGTVATVYGASGSSVTLSTGSGFTRTGFTLSRWDTSAAGTGSSYSKGQSITMPAGGLTLYAVWTANATTTTSPTTTSTTAQSTSTTSPSSVSTTVPPTQGGGAADPGAGAPTSPGATTPTTVGTGPRSSADARATSTTTIVASSTTVTSVAPTTTTSTVATDDDDADTPDIEGVEGGSLRALVAGRPVEVNVSESNGSLVAQVAGASVTYTVIGSDGLTRPLRRGSVISLGLGDRVRIDFAGFADMATGEAWVAPDGVSLGETPLAGGLGRIEAAVPETDRRGERRITAKAETIDGDPVVVAYGVEVRGTESSGTSWSLVFLVILGFAVVGALLVPAARRRRTDHN